MNQASCKLLRFALGLIGSVNLSCNTLEAQNLASCGKTVEWAYQARILINSPALNHFHILVKVGDSIESEGVHVLASHRNLYSVFSSKVPTWKPIYSALPIPFMAPHYRLSSAPVQMRFDLVELTEGESYLALTAHGHYNAGLARVFYLIDSPRGVELWMFDGLHPGYPSKGKILLARLNQFFPKGFEISEMFVGQERDERGLQTVTFKLEKVGDRLGRTHSVQIKVDTLVMDGKGILLKQTRPSPHRGSWTEGVLDYSMFSRIPGYDWNSGEPRVIPFFINGSPLRK